MKMTEDFEERFVKRIEQALDPKFEEIGRQFDKVSERFEKVDERLDNIEIEAITLRTEVECESKRICGMIQKLDDRVCRLEGLAKANWNVPELGYRLDAVETVTKKHTDQIRVLNERVGVAN